MTKVKKNTRLIFVCVLQAISHLNQSRIIRELSFSIINATVIESLLFNDVGLLFDQRYGTITLANNQLTRNNKGLNTSRVSFDNRHSIKETSRRKISKFRYEQERRKASSVTSSSGSLPGFMIGLCRPSDALRDQDFRWSVCNSPLPHSILSPPVSSLSGALACARNRQKSHSMSGLYTEIYRGLFPVRYYGKYRG